MSSRSGFFSFFAILQFQQTVSHVCVGLCACMRRRLHCSSLRRSLRRPLRRSLRRSEKESAKAQRVALTLQDCDTRSTGQTRPSSCVSSAAFSVACAIVAVFSLFRKSQTKLLRSTALQASLVPVRQQL
jgi:hypothetical protein